MASYFEADQKRTILKMRFSNYCWYKSSYLEPNDQSFNIVIVTSNMNKTIRKIIPTSIDGIQIKVDVDKPNKAIIDEI